MDPTISLLHHFPPSPSPSSPHISQKKQRLKKTRVFFSHQPQEPTTSSPLHDLASSPSLASTKQRHARLLRAHDDWDAAPATASLFRAYAALGDYASASRAFLVSLRRKQSSWDLLLPYFTATVSRHGHGVFHVLRELHRWGVVFDLWFLVGVLQFCDELSDFHLGFQIHCYLVKAGLDCEVYLRCALMNLYSTCGRSDSWERLFEEVPVVKDPLVWNRMVVLHAQEGNWADALELFGEMQLHGVRPEEDAVRKAVYACGVLGAVAQGKEVHGYAIRAGLVPLSPVVAGLLVGLYAKNKKTCLSRRVFESTVFESVEGERLVMWSSAVSCCARNGYLDDAILVFNHMVDSGMTPSLDLVTWNSILSGCSRRGFDREALRVFQMIIEEGLRPDSSTIFGVFRAINNLGLLRYGREVHGFVVRHELGQNVYMGTSLVNMYMKCGSLACAQRVFDTMENKNVYTWNLLISGYAEEGLSREAMDLVKKMEMEGLKPDLTTWNGLILGYSRNGLNTEAMLLIQQIRAKGLKPTMAAWTELICRNCRNGEFDESFCFFSEMQKEGIEPNVPIILSLLQACAALAMLKKGSEVHGFAVRKGLDANMAVASKLIDMYSKSGSLRNAQRIFARIQNKNLVCYNAMMMGFAIHGKGREAISLFHEMCDSGTKPDGISFTTLLFACKCTGLMTEGWKYFDDMEIHYGVTPTTEHYACMVNLLRRGGYLDEAMDFIEKMPVEPDEAVWCAFLGLR